MSTQATPDQLLNGIVHAAIVGNRSLANESAKLYADRAYPVVALVQNLAAYVTAVISANGWPDQPAPNAMQWAPTGELDLAEVMAGRVARDSVNWLLAGNIEGVGEMLTQQTAVTLSEAAEMLTNMLFDLIRGCHVPAVTTSQFVKPHLN